MAQICWLASFDENGYRNALKRVCISLIIVAYFHLAKISHYQLHDSHTWCPIAATMCFPTTCIWMINPNIVNSQHSPSCMNMTDIIIKSTKYQKETQNLSKKLQSITCPSTLHSARQIVTRHPNPCTTFQPVHSMLTMTNLQLCSRLYDSCWPKSKQWENLQCIRAHVAYPHPHQQQLFAPNQERHQAHGLE